MFTFIKTWNDARSHCKSLGGDLASVSSLEINTFLTILTSDQAWIGGYKSGSSWKWTDGSSVDYSNWMSGQPNNWGGNQDKIYINRDGLGGWDDDKGSSERYFICEKLKQGNEKFQFSTIFTKDSQIEQHRSMPDFSK